MKSFLFLLMIVFATSSYSSALQHPLDLSLPNNTIGQSVSVFEDTSGGMSFKEVQNLPSEAFVPLDKQVDSRLFTNSAFWYRFDVMNNKPASVSRLIVFGIPWLDHITVAVINTDGKLSVYRGGDTFPYDNRAIRHTFPNFEHEFQPGLSHVYVRVKTRDPFVVPISVVDRYTFLEETVGYAHHTGFIHGIIIAMLLYNLFLFLSIRERYYLFYALYLGLFMVMNASYNCLTFEWIFYDNPIWQNWAESTTIFLFSISGLMFAGSFLNLKKHFPSIHRTTQRLVLFYIGVMIFAPLMGYHYHVMFSITLAVFFSLYVFAVAFYVLYKGHNYARFFLLGTSAGLIGTSITSLSVMALIPYSDIGFRSVDYGMLIDAVLLSLALGERVKITQEEKLMAQREAKTDALTGLLNRRAYYEIGSAEAVRFQRYGGNLALIMLDIDYFKNINDTYGHTGGDRVLQKMGMLLKSLLREGDYAFRMGGEEFLILLPGTDTDKAAQLAERIREAVEMSRISFQNREITITLSMGVTEYSKNDNGIEDVIKRVDHALYTAKNRGRNQIIITD